MAIGNTTGSQVMNGADILVKSLVDHGVEVLFAYPGDCSMPLHQALTRYSDRLRTILPNRDRTSVRRLCDQGSTELKPLLPTFPAARQKNSSFRSVLFSR